MDIMLTKRERDLTMNVFNYSYLGLHLALQPAIIPNRLHGRSMNVYHRFDLM